MLKRYFPIVSWITEYNRSFLLKDFTAGITVGVMLIPQGMAYALIAGLPPVYGLYAALVPNLIYAFTGSSRKLAVGPVALDSLIVASSLAAMKLANIDDYISMAIFLALFVGCIQLVMGFMRLGFLSNFLSRPVVSGFTSAAALVIAISQLKHFFGLEITTNNTLKTLQAIFGQLSETNFYDLSIGLGAVLVILGLKKLSGKVPAAMVVVILSIVGIFFFMVNETDVHIVGEIPKGLPAFKMPQLDVDMMVKAFPTAMALAFIAFAEAMTIAKAVEDQSNEYHTEPNQELRALGISNIIGSLFQSFPANAGLSRTAVNVNEGAKTGIASLVSVLVVGLTLLFLTPFFYYLPKSVLGAIILVAVYSLIDLKYPKQLWKQRKDEFFLLLVTFLTTLLIGISQGIIFGVLFSLLLLVNRTSKPHIAILGRIRGTDYFKNVNRFSNDIELAENILVLRFDGQLYFANKDYFKSELHKNVLKKGNALKYVILNAEAINYIDSSALNMLNQVVKDLKGKKIELLIAGVIGPTRDILFSSGLIEQIGKGNLFVRTNEAFEYCTNQKEKSKIQDKVSLQSKTKHL
ncbi:solute carrier 26 family protein [Flagellimonas hymeniacidonis]|uniref:Solute carrier 26 family protein n=1 Tax=Flagellimonas hymeniacidonis TaxID=2603628 RepID=A0A5C8V831_9FLAO|nr:solute carrier family 26 protein [Flagellimonas hymeniacidonis]TXN37390.1 solute carrier 26 family protein [Flagellimonas hymeniacidonis]